MTVHQPADRFDPRPHAVVIGAGFGGLAAAIRLGRRGYRVTILERLEQVGGRASVFEQDGFRFDAGPTIITAPFVFEELWDICGERMADHVTLKPMEPCYAIRFDDGRTFRCYSDAGRMREEVRRLAPGDVEGWERFMLESERCYRIGFEKMAVARYDTLGRLAKALPDLIRRRADRSVHALVSRHVKDPALRIALSFHPLFIGGNPLRASAVLSLIQFLEREWGVNYAMGGTGALVQGLADLARRQGHAIRLNATVERILVESGRAAGVRLEGGETVPADIVVSNADVSHTYRHMLPGARRKRWTDARIDRAAHSMSLFVWYFGTDRQWPEVDHHTVLMGPRYEGLLADIFDNKVLAEDFSLYLHRPTATDPSVAPAGHDGFYVLAPVPNLDGDTDWTTQAEPFRRRIEAHLARTVLPGLSRHVVTSKTFTPLDFRDRLLSVKGAAFSLEPRLTQIAWFRPHNVSEEVDGLYIVGAGTHPGAGLPGVVSAAKVLDLVVPHGETLLAASADA